MAWTIISPENMALGAQRITEKSTTQRHPFGMVVQAVDPTYGAGEFVYLKGVASTVVGSWVTYMEKLALGLTTLAVANGNGSLAVSMTTNTTTTSYAWYQIRGRAQALGLTSITHSTGFLWLTGTGGSVDDASVIGDAVVNARKSTTVHVVGTFLDTYVIDRPFVANRVYLSN